MKSRVDSAVDCGFEVRVLGFEFDIGGDSAWGGGSRGWEERLAKIDVWLMDCMEM